MTNRDREILQALTLFVRLFSQAQIADCWFEGDKANARRRLRQLTGRDLVNRVTVRARTLPPLERPVITWRPGDADPNFSQAAYALRHRWTGRCVRSVTAYIATEKAGQLFGTHESGELKKPAQAGHDLGVAQIWLQLAASAPPWANAWRGEDVMAHTRLGEKLPDGFIVKNDEVVCVMEFGGSYDEQRVRAFHDDCRHREMPYQIW
jgi:hypothetical protein